MEGFLPFISMVCNVLYTRVRDAVGCGSAGAWSEEDCFWGREDVEKYTFTWNLPQRAQFDRFESEGLWGN